MSMYIGMCIFIHVPPAIYLCVCVFWHDSICMCIFIVVGVYFVLCKKNYKASIGPVGILSRCVRGEVSRISDTKPSCP